MREISKYIGRDYAFGTDIKKSLENEVIVVMQDSSETTLVGT